MASFLLCRSQQSRDEYQENGTDGRHDNAAHHAATGTQAKCAKQPAANNCASNPQNQIPDQAVAITFHN